MRTAHGIYVHGWLYVSVSLCALRVCDPYIYICEVVNDITRIHSLLSFRTNFCGDNFAQKIVLLLPRIELQLFIVVNSEREFINCDNNNNSKCIIYVIAAPSSSSPLPSSSSSSSSGSHFSLVLLLHAIIVSQR